MTDFYAETEIGGSVIFPYFQNKECGDVGRRGAGGRCIGAPAAVRPLLILITNIKNICRRRRRPKL
jgi:hypothetical protein